MNPDPYTRIDPETPLRFDHLLHLLTGFALCVPSSWSSPGQL
jgi:S-DNA-T family DNA segregation ATPase FtsK/SpoIIIE